MSARISPLVDPQTDPELLRARQADLFGSFVGRLSSVCEESSVSAEVRDEWLRLVAEEVLLARLCGADVHVSWPILLEGVKPLAGRADTFEELMLKVRWVAVIPLHRSGQPSGTLIRVWGIEGELDSSWVEGEMDAGVTLRLGGWENPLNGSSWQLATRLAARAAEEKRADLQFDLATKWIITGAMTSAGVEAVEVGNKIRIRTDRRWLVPETNSDDFRPLMGRFNTASTLDAAWTHLSGEGMLGHDQIAWPQPEEIEEFHATTSFAIRTVISAILLTRPRKVVLWHSGNEAESTRYATLAEEFFTHPHVRSWSGWEGSPPEVKSLKLPDSDVIAGEKVLREAGLDQPRSGKILFHITCGNFLMKLAVFQIAKINPSIWLIYREKYLEITEVFLLRNSGRSPLVGRMLEQAPASDIHWEFVKDSAVESVDALVNEVFGSSVPDAQSPATR